MRERDPGERRLDEPAVNTRFTINVRAHSVDDIRQESRFTASPEVSGDLDRLDELVNRVVADEEER